MQHNPHSGHRNTALEPATTTVTMPRRTQQPGSAVWLLGLALLIGCSEASEASPTTSDATAAQDAPQTADAGGQSDADGADDAQTADATDAELAADSEAVVDTVADAGTTADANSIDDAAQTDAGSKPDASKVCTPGQQQCAGALLSTCAAKGDGWITTPCFPGLACQDGLCSAVASNLILVVDSSGSMDEDVQGPDGKNKCPSSSFVWPMCDSGPEYPTGCTRMGVSKYVLSQAIVNLSPAKVRTAMFRFPQSISSTLTGNCTSGFYDGQSTLKGDDDSHQITETTSWYWNQLGDTLCSPYPALDSDNDLAGVSMWLDGKEIKNVDPELRADGGTPIGKTLFYVGEYLRNRVIVDGKACTVDADCGSVHYRCTDGVCADPARSCRETVVVLFTDGGESNSPSDFFSPWVQAKRLAMGLGCSSNVDCVGGATCQAGRCLSTQQSTGYGCSDDGDACDPTVAKPCSGSAVCQPMPFFCSTTGTACQPFGTTPDSPLHCASPGYCIADPRPLQTAIGKPFTANVLRSPDGKPFGVKVFVVDISGETSQSAVKGSFSIALAGSGKLLGADAADPGSFLKVVGKAFDIKNGNVCGK